MVKMDALLVQGLHGHTKSLSLHRVSKSVFKNSLFHRYFQAPEHDANHSNVNQRFGMFGFSPISAQQASALHQTSKGALHNPPLPHYVETLAWLGTFHYLPIKFALRSQSFDPGNQFSQVAHIGSDGWQAPLRMHQGRQQILVPVAVLHVGGLDEEAQDQS
jgi:hypothetical protein